MSSSGVVILFSQLFKSVPKPTDNHERKTVIVTGSNIGLGLEAARPFTRLGASKVILAVRSTNKGEQAKENIERKTDVKNIVEVWQLDMLFYQSVLDFAARIETELERLDIVVINAGISARKFEIL